MVFSFHIHHILISLIFAGIEGIFLFYQTVLELIHMSVVKESLHWQLLDFSTQIGTILEKGDSATWPTPTEQDTPAVSTNPENGDSVTLSTEQGTSSREIQEL